MDIGGQSIRKLIAVTVLVTAAGIALAAEGDLFTQSQRWIAPGREMEVLSTLPAACLASDRQDDPRVQAGRALFNSPFLLGGQATRTGLSCAACHLNGRDNPNFQLGGISAGPGTADVTSSFFSTARHNAVFDPVVIPDLSKPGKISRDPVDESLERFIRNLVVEEFSGAEPTPAMLEALSAYVRAIKPCGDNDGRFMPHELEEQLTLIDAALAGAAAMRSRGDVRAERLMFGAARHQLGLIHERYAGAQLTSERKNLLLASRRLQAISETRGLKTPEKLATWRRTFERDVVPRLIAARKRSLYNPDLLAKRLGTDR